MLSIVAVPIGDTQEITFRALEVLRQAEVIICESTKETSKLLKVHGLTGKKYVVLDEHSTPEDIEDLAKECTVKHHALVSDCGTPVFCDPGSHLIAQCRKLKIKVQSILGPSALMGLLSLSSQRIDEFVFRGFLPAENQARAEAWKKLQNEKRAIILMDTPYRLKKIILEVSQNFPKRLCLLALNLSQPEEKIIEAQGAELGKHCTFEKAEFMLLIYASSTN